jgi:hypothetical protein
MTWSVFIGTSPFRPRTDLRVFAESELAEAKRYYDRLERQGRGLVWVECDGTASDAARLMRERASA